MPYSMSCEEKLASIIRAWDQENGNPNWHRQQIERLRVEWPNLYYALIRILPH